MKQKMFLFVSAMVLVLSAQAQQQQPPDCLSGKSVLAINNDAVLNWKATTKNQYLNRGHIKGTLVRDLPDQSGHQHFEVRIGDKPNDLIEVIYNIEFGTIGLTAPGDSFEACGDYITANAAAGGYQPSPDGAILHWVHLSDNTKSHASGYVMINGVLYGQRTLGHVNN
ncbi:MAG: hypothetical protein ACXWQQ_09065 [Pseudobdellovibrio sp.]